MFCVIHICSPVKLVPAMDASQLVYRISTERHPTNKVDPEMQSYISIAMFLGFCVKLISANNNKYCFCKAMLLFFKLHFSML